MASGSSSTTTVHAAAMNRLQVAMSMLDSHNHSEAVGHLELATGKHVLEAVIPRSAPEITTVACVPQQRAVSGVFSFAPSQQQYLVQLELYGRIASLRSRLTWLNLYEGEKLLCGAVRHGVFELLRALTLL